MRAPALAVLLGATALAGCLAQPAPIEEASAPPAGDVVHELKELVDAWIELPDGLRAHGTVYLPDVPEGTRVPVVMDLGPYYGNLGGETDQYNEELPPNQLYANLLKHGYAIALVSLRGTGQSEGCFKIGGAEEQADAAAIVEWLASQAWSNGKVGMTGVSYDGTTPWEAAVTGTPGLAAIVPVEGITDMYRYSFFEGVPIWGGPAFNTYYSVDVDYLYTGQHLATWGPGQPTNVCPEAVDVVTYGWQTYLLEDGVHDAFWDERDTSAMLGDIKAATFVVHGFQDWNVKMDHVQAIWDDLPEPKRMLLGQWEHNIPWRNSLNRDWDFPAYNATIRQWFDAFLKDDAAAREAALAGPKVLAQDSTGAWWELDAWPPAQSQVGHLHLTAERKLSAQPSNESGEARFRAWPFGAAGMRPLWEGLGPMLGMEGTLATFVSPTLEAPLHLAGNPTMTLAVTVDQPGGYVEAMLYDLDPLGALTLVTEGYQNLATRESRDAAQEVPVGEPMELDLKMYALHHVLQPGHRLVLAIDGYSDDRRGGFDWAPKDGPTGFTLDLAPGKSVAHLPVLAGALPVWEPEDREAEQQRRAPAQG